MGGAEGEEQCDRLFRDYAAPRVTFAFLTPSGRPPESATGEARQAFKPLSFARVASLLRAAARERAGCGTPLARSAVHSYLGTLEKEF